MGYRSIIDGIALSQIQRVPDIPDYHLMIGSAEDLSPQPVTVYTNAKVPKEIVSGWEHLNKYNNEDIQQAIADGNLEVNDLASGMHLMGLGGV